MEDSFAGRSHHNAPLRRGGQRIVCWNHACQDSLGDEDKDSTHVKWRVYVEAADGHPYCGALSARPENRTSSYNAATYADFISHSREEINVID